MPSITVLVMPSITVLEMHPITVLGLPSFPSLYALHFRPGMGIISVLIMHGITVAHLLVPSVFGNIRR